MWLHRPPHLGVSDLLAWISVGTGHQISLDACSDVLQNFMYVSWICICMLDGVCNVLNSRLRDIAAVSRNSYSRLFKDFDIF
jgi:hypothetical protein